MIKSKNILKQEQEFLKLNAEIESKTKDLLSEVDHIKEVQSDIEKLYSNWENDNKNEESFTNQTSEVEDEKEKADDSEEGNYGLMEYLSKIKNGATESPTSSTEDSKSKDQLNSRKNSKKNLKSTKTSILSTTTLGEEPIVSLELSRLKSGANLKRGETDCDVIPETLKGVGYDGIMRFLTAKVKVLTEQLSVLQKDEKEHVAKIKELQSQRERSIEEQNKLIQQVNMSRSLVVKLEQHSDRVGIQLQNAKAENSSLKKEIEGLKKELRETNKKSNGNDIRLNRALEEVEKLKSALNQKTHEEKEFKESSRKKTEELTNVIRKLERQRGELLHGFKKQLLIIDNLKTQKGLIEVDKVLRDAEEDFINFLDCNPPNTVS